MDDIIFGIDIGFETSKLIWMHFGQYLQLWQIVEIVLNEHEREKSI